jgi:hypothetical protein
MDQRAMKMAQARKAGRAMGASATPDMMGRAMPMRGDMSDKMGRAMASNTMKKGGKVKSGGSYRKAADGIASKGKTKGKMVKMMRGGEC